MAQFNQNDFETTLLNRAELEQALGIKINLNNNATHLDDYAMHPEINLHDVVCIFLGMHPENWNAHEHPRYNTIFNAIKQSAETGKITARIEQDKNGFNQIFLTHDTIRQYAQTYNLQWNVPPYREIEINTQTADNSELVQQLTAKDEEIARLKAEIENLSKLAIQKNETEQEQTKDNEFTPCYLNKFTKPDPLAIAIQIRNSEWKDYNPETDAKKSATQIKKKIKSNHEGISDTLAEMIEKVACPIDRTRNK